MHFTRYAIRQIYYPYTYCAELWKIDERARQRRAKGEGLNSQLLQVDYSINYIVSTSTFAYICTFKNYNKNKFLSNVIINQSRRW